MEKVPLKSLVNKIKNYREQKMLYKQEVLCATCLCNFFKEQTSKNYQVFKRLYDDLPKNSKVRSIKYCVLYIKKQRGQQEEQNKKIKKCK